MNLTSIQKKAAEFKDGPCLVLAVPGAGKTTMLLERIKILSKNIDSKKILTLTFSKTQSQDMKNRFGTNDSNFMTIHAFCYLIIRNYLKKYNRELRLIEASDSYNKYHLVRDIYKSINNNKKLSREDVETFFTETSYMKNALLDQTYLDKVRIKNIKEIYNEYERFKKENHFIDFDDMQLIALKLLEENPRLLRSIQRKYQYFQLDEGQDSSILQFKILKMIVSQNNNLMVVADDDQSIYSFRAAEPDYLLNFKTYYPDSEIIIMDENHRSSANISSLANQFIKLNKNRYQKDIISNKEKGEKIVIKYLKDFKDEYDFIIKNLDPNKTNAILFRNNISAINLISFLLEDDIDFTISEDFLKFFESQIIEDIFDVIRFSEDFNDTEAFTNIYYKISTYLKKSEIEGLANKPARLDVFSYFYDILDYDRRESLYEIEKKLKHIRKLPLDRKIAYIYNYLAYKKYASLRSNKFAEENMNKDLFIESLTNFSRGLNNISDFYKKIDLVKDKIKFTFGNPLILTTIHKSKGLEYDRVFIIDMVKNEFPMVNYDENPDVAIEEERRVFYVAMTRAKESLFILTIKKRNGKKALPSEFFSQVYQINKTAR
ncbi:ATP-dependent helicase [uncultured Anaerococcus sp.]|uniref:ATP-dependent helicase n=1 Tax=uncultured Anaerococcus sp. TaxID=293428 RepID=UPI00288A1B73|nr:ATP-dependent helicase [uncultured Anaerococcus sp.]